MQPVVAEKIKNQDFQKRCSGLVVPWKMTSKPTSDHSRQLCSHCDSLDPVLACAGPVKSMHTDHLMQISAKVSAAPTAGYSDLSKLTPVQGHATAAKSKCMCSSCPQMICSMWEGAVAFSAAQSAYAREIGHASTMEGVSGIICMCLAGMQWPMPYTPGIAQVQSDRM